MITREDWQKENKWEMDWWGNCANTYNEQIKQDMMVGYLNLRKYVNEKADINMMGKSILDIGGGPVSLLLRVVGATKRVVVDPCNYPEWVKSRYEQCGINFLQILAEDMEFSDKFNEVWLYNCLEHVMNPEQIAERAMMYGKKIRICEYLLKDIWPGHPQLLTKDRLDKMFNREGLIDTTKNPPIYYGVFNYGE